MKNLQDTFVLNNGVRVPVIGFGTWLMPDEETTVEIIDDAIRDGYRHIDTAEYYKNEKSIGEAVKKSGLKREDLFITSKVWNTDSGYDKTMAAFERTLKNLGTDYLDLYLIHWPAVAAQYDNWEEINLDTWRALTDLYKAGKVRAIGVSNFLPHHLEALMKTEVPPMVDQIEFHPGNMQKDTLEYCRNHNIQVEAWSPLGRGRVLSDPELQKIADKYGKSVSQLCIRWALQNGVIPLPKSVTPSRIQQNADVFDFEISQEDMNTINSMPDFGGSGLDPDHPKF